MYCLIVDDECGTFHSNATLFIVYSEAAALAIKGIDENAELPDEPHLAESLTEALKQLKEGSNLLEEQFQSDNLGGMFANMGLDDVSIWPFNFSKYAMQ